MIISELSMGQGADPNKQGVPKDGQAVKKRFKELTVLSNERLTILYDRDTLNLRLLPSGPGKQLQLLIQSIDVLPDDSPVWDQIDKITNYFTDLKLDVPEETEGYKEIKESEDEKVCGTASSQA